MLDAPAATTRWIDYGKDNYAGVTWANVPGGRRLFLGWMSNWQYANVVPTASWRSATTVPRELTLKNTPGGIRLLSQPVRELASLRGESVELKGRSVSGTVEITQEIPFQATTSEMVLAFKAPRGGTSKAFGVVLSNGQGQKVQIGYDPGRQSFFVDRSGAGNNSFSKDFAGRHPAPRVSTADSIKLHLVIDVASVELFADDGEVVMTEIFFPDAPFKQVSLFSDGGAAQLTTGKITALQSIWQGNGQVATNK